MFLLEGKSGEARAGKIKTEKGEIETPVFMPVGTQGSVKMMTQEWLDELNFPIILGNTYHLYLRPGHKLIEENFGDLHSFISWRKPILTDSGGYQVFSLKHLQKKTTDAGVEFASHWDGSIHLLSPEKSMEIQKALGSDIVMAFDDCPALPATKEDLKKSLERTLKWERRSRNYELKPHQKIFGIVQGGLHLDLRTDCLQALEEMNFDGYALGGLSVGEKNDEMVSFCKEFVPMMPEDKPRYLMGVGKPLDILNGIKNGLDMFDCVLPTRNARNGQAQTQWGPLNIKNNRFLKDTGPIDSSCACFVCKRYSRAYVRHLIMVGEYLGGILLSYHNLYFYKWMMRQARGAILERRFDEFYQRFYNNYTSQN
ncbi:MAG: tRNA guanosine(34) transglycosylase Tgt [Bacteriovoracaceae bacterium]|nr:tRNA guanosine(34) transglycosylase Tgt [Bacteriovoracaceae bacterium]